MKVEYINPFVEASQNIIRQTTGLDPVLGSIYTKDIPKKGEHVAVLIGITGSIQGTVIMSFKKPLACKIVSFMLGGMPVPELDEIAKSAIAELCNMILGNTASIFSQKDIGVDITPPTVLTGENMQFSPAKSVTVCVPLEFEDGDTMDIDIIHKVS
ncbi:MAG: CheC protein [Clostridia bacterium]|jgi:chemotaxis protein CheX|nr:CheC protein [Clostridia bacterium]